MLALKFMEINKLSELLWVSEVYRIAPSGGVLSFHVFNFFLLSDEVPSNCAKFIEHGGLDISMSAIEVNNVNNFIHGSRRTGLLEGLEFVL